MERQVDDVIHDFDVLTSSDRISPWSNDSLYNFYNDSVLFFIFQTCKIIIFHVSIIESKSINSELIHDDNIVLASTFIIKTKASSS